MRILLVTHYFPPETGAPQARLSALASTWAADGDAVTVLTGMPNHPPAWFPRVPGRDPAAGAAGRLSRAAHLAVRNAE